MRSALAGTGRALFSFAIISLGMETLVCGIEVGHPVVSTIGVLQIIPWVATIPQLAIAGGAVLICCGVGLLLRPTLACRDDGPIRESV